VDGSFETAWQILQSWSALLSSVYFLAKQVGSKFSESSRVNQSSNQSAEHFILKDGASAPELST
jgi:hypothetical protein